jgi:predicted PurR-regulated permease PerM
MRLNGQSSTGNGFITLASFTIITAVLYLAKEVFVPIALASLLSFVLAPLVDRLSRWAGKTLAVIIVACLAFSAIAVVGWGVMSQVIQLAEELPNYQHNLQAKINTLKSPKGKDVISRTAGMVKQLQREIESLASETEETNAPSLANVKEAPPVPVEIRSTRTTASEVISGVVGPVLRPLGTAAVVVIFVIFMLLQKEDLRDRFIKLISGGELNVATQAVDDAMRRVSRY